MTRKVPPKRSLTREAGKVKPTVHPVIAGTVKKELSSQGINALLPLTIILVITFIAFLPSLRNGFVLWDDPEYTFENPFLKDFSLSRIFSFSTFYMGNYHPLTLLWLHC